MSRQNPTESPPDIGPANSLAAPLVSVCMITYNHERFIAQAIDSVLIQETDFEVELVIGEDCSTDSTRSIARGYQERYPNRVRLLTPDQNMGMARNLVQTLHACRGEFIATLEGDDYWTDPRKLQKQIDFLKAHPNCTVCAHDAAVLDEQTGETTPFPRPRNPPDESGIEVLIAANFLPTCSVIYRAAAGPAIPDWFYSLQVCDWALHALYAHGGTIGFIDERMAAYRVHAGGVWSLKDPIWTLKETNRMLRLLDAYFNGQYRQAVRLGIANGYRFRGNRALAEKKYGMAWRMYCGTVRHRPAFLADTEFRQNLLRLAKRTVTGRR